MIAHTKVVGSRELVPMYTTNPNVANPSGWCLPQPLKTGRTREEFRIDFWVICDEEHAHLFSSNQRGEVLRIACPIDTFPHGFASAHEQVAIGPVRGETETGTWRLFEAQHVYRVKNIQRYFMLAECAYERRAPPGSRWLDSTNRFLIGFTADRLEGPWSRLEGEAQTHWATAEDLQTSLIWESAGRGGEGRLPPGSRILRGSAAVTWAHSAGRSGLVSRTAQPRTSAVLREPTADTGQRPTRPAATLRGSETVDRDLFRVRVARDVSRLRLVRLSRWGAAETLGQCALADGR